MPDWEDLNRLKGAFNRFDDDRSGTIDRQEFEQLLATIGADMSDDEIDEGFATIDVDGSGQIEFDEFVDWWESLR